MEKPNNKKESFGLVSLVRASAEDLDQFLALEKSVDGQKVYSATTDNEGALAEIQNNFVYFIKRGDEIVGSVVYEIKGEGYAYLGGLVIDPRFQGQGLARQALEGLLEKLKDMKRIDLVTHPDNVKALGLYKSLGFVEEGRRENYYGDGEPRLVLALNR